MNLLDALTKFLSTDPILRDVRDYMKRPPDEEELRHLIVKWYVKGFRDGRKTL